MALTTKGARGDQYESLTQFSYFERKRERELQKNWEGLGGEDELLKAK